MFHSLLNANMVCKEPADAILTEDAMLILGYFCKNAHTSFLVFIRLHCCFSKNSESIQLKCSVFSATEDDWVEVTFSLIKEVVKRYSWIPGCFYKMYLKSSAVLSSLQIQSSTPQWKDSRNNTVWGNVRLQLCPWAIRRDASQCRVCHLPDGAGEKKVRSFFFFFQESLKKSEYIGEIIWDTDC